MKRTFFENERNYEPRIMKAKVNETDIRGYINERMSDWLFGKRKFAQYHMNATPEELRKRIGTYSDSGHLISRASSFADAADGDDIMSGFIAAMGGRAKEILKWISDDSVPEPLTLRFRRMPYGVRGYACSAYEDGVREGSGFCIVLEKGDIGYSFYIRTAYPCIPY